MGQKIVAQSVGQDETILDFTSGMKVSDVQSKLGLAGSYTATVNGDDASSDTALRAGDFISFQKSVKGGM